MGKVVVVKFQILGVLSFSFLFFEQDLAVMSLILILFLQRIILLCKYRFLTRINIPGFLFTLLVFLGSLLWICGARFLGRILLSGRVSPRYDPTSLSFSLFNPLFFTFNHFVPKNSLRENELLCGPLTRR